MISKIVKTILILAALIVFGYLTLPNPDFPTPPPDALQSKEPADIETSLRRAYFTNYTREEVMGWYAGRLERSATMGIALPTYRLNYPPEEAQIIIRDQTRSTFLEEIVHPMRESVFINGFEPAAGDGQNAINIEGKHWRQKIIVRYIPSNLWVRIGIFALIIISVAALLRAYKKSVLNFFHE